MPNDVTGTDPQLGALANNGGTTNTHLPGTMSPVLNTIPNGTSDCGTVITTSQNGAMRPQQSACEKGSAERLAPTAASAFVQGQVKTPSGTGIRNVIVEINGVTLANPIRVQTGSFGYFRFTELEVGQTYIITIHSKRYEFSNPTRVVSLFENISNFDFVSETY